MKTPHSTLYGHRYLQERARKNGWVELKNKSIPDMEREVAREGRYRIFCRVQGALVEHLHAWFGRHGEFVMGNHDVEARGKGKTAKTTTAITTLEVAGGILSAPPAGE